RAVGEAENYPEIHAPPAVELVASCDQKRCELTFRREPKLENVFVCAAKVKRGSVEDHPAIFTSCHESDRIPYLRGQAEFCSWTCRSPWERPSAAPVSRCLRPWAL